MRPNVYNFLHMLQDDDPGTIYSLAKFAFYAFKLYVRCSAREFRIERRRSHRAILNLEQVTPLVYGGGGAPPPEQLTNTQTSHYTVAAKMHNLAVRHRTMLNSFSF